MARNYGKLFGEFAENVRDPQYIEILRAHGFGYSSKSKCIFPKINLCFVITDVQFFFYLQEVKF